MAESPLLKIFEAAIDLKRPVAIRPFEVVEGDTGNRLLLTLTDDGEAVDMDGLLIMAVFSNSNGISVQSSDDGSVTADGNELTIDLNPASFAPGMVECELQLYSSEEEDPQDVSDCGVLVTTAKFNFTCRRAILNGETLPAAPMFPLLAGLVQDVETAEAERAAAEAARIAAESARAANEAARQSNEAVRQSNEALRQSNESTRISLEAARINAERARETAEETRERNEAARRTAETARAAAEAAREATLAELIASIPDGALILETAPTASTEGEPGRLALTPSTGKAYICADAHEGDGTVADPPRYTWRMLAYESEWEPLNSVTVAEPVQSIEIDKDSGGAAFCCDELRVTVLGGMSGGTTVKIFVNGQSTYNTSFAPFMTMNCTFPERAMTLLHIKKPYRNFMIAERIMGGDPDGSGANTSRSPMTGIIRQGETPITGYTAVKLTGSTSNYKFIAGTQVILEGRNIH